MARRARTVGIGYHGSGSTRCHRQTRGATPLLSAIDILRLDPRARPRSDPDNTRHANLSLFPAVRARVCVCVSDRRRRRRSCGRRKDGGKEKRGARNVKLSWLNTGQIYRTIDAFGPLQPAVVDISLRRVGLSRGRNQELFHVG